MPIVGCHPLHALLVFGASRSLVARYGCDARWNSPATTGASHFRERPRRGVIHRDSNLVFGVIEVRQLAREPSLGYPSIAFREVMGFAWLNPSYVLEPQSRSRRPLLDLVPL
jgi:hypothetical protein